MEIKKLNRVQIEESIPLIWNVFCKYEAVNYPKSGREAFWNAINASDYLDMLTAYGAFDDKKLIGIIATRNEGSHIALFFVDEKYHRQGIGRKLFEVCMTENKNTCITVHSSEYAVDVYRRLGFTQTDEIQEDGGIRYVDWIKLREYDTSVGDYVNCHCGCLRRICIRQKEKIPIKEITMRKITIPVEDW